MLSLCSSYRYMLARLGAASVKGMAALLIAGGLGAAFLLWLLPGRAAGGRSIVTERWDTVFRVGSSDARDTVLLQPYRVYLWSDKVAVIDVATPKIVVFSQTGEFQWSFGRRGHGPGELEVTPLSWLDSIPERTHLVLAAAAVPDRRACVYAFKYGPGFTISAGGAPKHFRYIEAVPFEVMGRPRMLARGGGSAVGIVQADSTRYGAHQISVARDERESEIHMLFGGRPQRPVHEEQHPAR